MQIHTMAMLITDKNWSVAAAVLGAEVTGEPPANTYGSFLVINTFEDGNVYRSPGIRRHSNFGDLTLRNILLESDEFNYMFDYDKRTKNLEQFFNVTHINKRPVKIHPDAKIDAAVQALNEAWNNADD